MSLPDTRPSLILRLPNLQDVEAWTEFAEIYEPLVYRLGRKLGMQDADAQEATQEVMLHLAKVVEDWEPSSTGSFRGWLYRVARNVMLRQVEKLERHPKGTGDTRQHALLGKIEASQKASATFEIEFQRQVFAWAARKVRAEVEHSTWQAFWLTFVEQEPVTSAASKLGLSAGNVYVARSRVMKRMRETVQRQIDREWADINLDRIAEAEAT